MAIKQITPKSNFGKYLQDKVKAYEEAVIRRLSYCGERCLIQARDFGSYTDRTGNLRSSTGYVIVKDGKIVKTGGFEVVSAGSDGSTEGQSFAKNIARQFSQGIALIVVAGMKYASYVEAKGYDVLTSSEMLANRIVPEMLKNLNIAK